MKIGILGWHTPTGIGYMNWDMWQLGFADAWFAPQHPLLGVSNEPVGNFVSYPLEGHASEFRAFLERIDVLVIVERVFLPDVDVWAECRRRRKLVCCVPMMEFMPATGSNNWLLRPNCMWAVNKQAYGRLTEYSLALQQRKVSHAWRNAVMSFRWGVNTGDFTPQVRKTCNEFLFINGWGGTANRKGIEAVIAAAELCPDIPIRMISQTRDLPELPPNIVIDNKSHVQRRDMYDVEGCLLAPSRWEGLGLQLWEAYASGVPVLTTDFPPMNELPGAVLLPAKMSTLQLNSECKTQVADVPPTALAASMRKLIGTDITEMSRAAIGYAQKHDLRGTFDSVRGQLEKRWRALRGE